VAAAAQRKAASHLANQTVEKRPMPHLADTLIPQHRFRAPYVLRLDGENPFDAIRRYCEETGHVGHVIVTDRPPL
jgi:hypothetical protein